MNKHALLWNSLVVLLVGHPNLAAFKRIPIAVVAAVQLLWLVFRQIAVTMFLRLYCELGSVELMTDPELEYTIFPGCWASTSAKEN